MNFLSPYQRKEYLSFLQGTLLTDSFTRTEESLDPEFKPQFLQKANLIGRDKNLELDIWEIVHTSENDPRVGISKDIFRLMAKYGTKRLLAIIISRNSDNYRLSLATIELTLDGSKVKKHYSNPRRYSFFLGPDSKIHTPEQFLIKKGRVSDFDDLLSRFSVEIVNKEFYNQIAYQFSELVGGQRKVNSQLVDFSAKLKLPSTNDHGKLQEFAVRLIGRLVFCWFLKRKKSINGISLIDDAILSSASVKANSDYYHSVLENLFFQILNTPISDRLEEFKKGIYKNIPFLNGGLFEPHEDDFYKISDRTGIPTISYDLKIPDKWFITLFEILETYNFTIDENTSVDIDLSVDPEMLGRIFENLLAEINPETGETARKSTGSFYTPRTVVEYMVDEALKQYLITNTGIEESKLSNLISYSGEEIEISDAQREKIVTALDEVKILDPACGSGAFPIGVLQKMLLVLQKVDHESKLWFNKMLNKIDNTTIRNTIKEKFKDENLDYIRKLGIIQEAIYGVDIQTIAVEISKLRCFLTLIVDEEVDDDRTNRGIIPLPNLEFKFVTANTLVGLPRKETPGNIDLFDMDDEVIELKTLRDEYFRSYGKQKERLEIKFVEKQKEIAKSYFAKQSRDTAIIKLANWNPFVNEKSDWFDPDWMFGIKDGFHIIIGNPPYFIAKASNTQKEVLKKYLEYYSADFKVNLFALFLELGINYSSNNAVNSFIIPDSSLNLPAFKKLREYILKHAGLKYVAHFNEDVFENAEVGKSVILEYVKGISIERFMFRSFTKTDKCTETHIDIKKVLKDSGLKFVYKSDNIEFDNLLDKVKAIKTKLVDYCDIYDGINPGSEEIKNTLITKQKIDNYSKKIIDGKCFTKYSSISWNGDYIYYNEMYVEKLRRKIESRGEDFTARIIKKTNYFIYPKIITRQTADTIIGTIDLEKYYVKNSVHSTLIKEEYVNEIDLKTILAFLNSKLIDWYYRTESLESGRLFPQVKIERLRNLPIVMPDKVTQKKMNSLVDKIMSLEEDTHLRNQKTLEEIDIIIYKIYSINYDEAKIIDPNLETTIKKTEYDKIMPV
jgi:hypothetical protein